uniref:Si:ch73-127m5.3 n=1 Tax=Hucho hucho TaxID=62062 RepID=A0A4W5MEG6_9TELE
MDDTLLLARPQYGGGDILTAYKYISRSLCRCSTNLHCCGIIIKHCDLFRTEVFSASRMRTPVALLCLVALCAAQKRRITEQNSEWDYRTEAEKVNTRVCANLTLVLDNWKFAIMTQVRDLLLNDHSTVLPDYGRIPPLSDALGDLYKEFNALKERLGELTTKFEGVEAFVDDVRAGRSPTQSRAEPRPLTPDEEIQSTTLTGTGEGTGTGTGTRPQGRRNRVVVRRVKIPANGAQV